MYPYLQPDPLLVVSPPNPRFHGGREGGSQGIRRPRPESLTKYATYKLCFVDEKLEKEMFADKVRQPSRRKKLQLSFIPPRPIHEQCLDVQTRLTLAFLHAHTYVCTYPRTCICSRYDRPFGGGPVDRLHRTRLSC